MKGKKQLISVLLTVMLVSVALFAGCKDRNKDHGEAGTYCYFATDYTYEMVVDGGNYTVTTPDGKVSGKYEFDKDVMQMTSSDKKKASAELENGNIVVTFDGADYTFYKKTNYTVTFVTGGENVTVEVQNGTAAQKPATDPVKEGNVFVGWYADEACTVAYNFATQITGNKKVYARFTPVMSGTEYTVTFVNGTETTTSTTVNGKVVNLPAVSDEDFVGWWVSDYEDANKLSYQYTDQVFKANTTLFAVYNAGKGTTVSVNEEGATWTNVGPTANYIVRISGPEGSEPAKTVGTTKYAYDFTDKPAGDYTVSVTVNNVAFVAYYKNKAMTRVSQFDVEGTLLKFNTVENAEKYLITIDCGDKEHVHTDMDLGNKTVFDFANCEMQEGGIKFVVKAVADGYATSVSNAFVVERSLAAVTGLKVENEVATWGAVNGATSYTVEVTVGGNTYTDEVTGTSYSLKTFAKGETTVKVTANAKGYFGATAQAVYTKSTISAPEGVTVNNGVISWDAVQGATSYVVKVDGTEYTTSTTTFNATSYVSAKTAYSVQVKAVSANATETSLYSDAVNTVATMGEIKFENGKVTWAPVAKATKYFVRVNGGAETTIDDGSCAIVPTFTKAGKNTVEVCAYVNNTRSGWFKLDVNCYRVSFDTLGGEKIPTVYYADGSSFDVADPVATLNRAGYDFGGWYNLPGGATENGKKVGGTYFTEGQDVALYAYWTPHIYTLTLDYDGQGENTVGEAKYNTYFDLPVPVSEQDSRLAFSGWYSMPNAEGIKYTDQYGESFGVWEYAEDRTLYAGWAEVFRFNEINNGNAYSVSQGREISKVIEVTVPTTYNNKPVTIVEGSAFNACGSLAKINIPDTVQVVETGTAFLNCTALQEINVYETENNVKGNYSSKDGVLLYYNEYNSGIELKYFPLGKGGEYVIPAEVQTLPTAIFKSSVLQKVTIPATVTHIDTNAFYLSKQLKTVVFEDAEHPEDAQLVIGEYAFRGCAALEEVTFPKHLTSFQSNLFNECKLLQRVNISDNAGIAYTSKDGVLCSLDGSTLVYCPVGRTGAYTVPAGVSEIAAEAFKGCISLSKVTFPGYVEKISESAFYGCTQLTEVIFQGNEVDDALTIEKSAFYGCTALDEVTLPANLKTLGAYAFGGTTYLFKVTVNSTGDVNFSANAFGTNASPSVFYIKELDIGAKLGVIDVSSVFGATNIQTLSVDAANPNYTVQDDVLFNKDITKIAYYPANKLGAYVIPSTITEIGNSVFDSKKITAVTIGKNVTTIGSKAFANTSSLQTVTFEDGGTADLVIGADAFNNSAIATVAIPARTISLGQAAFKDCKFLESVTLNGSLNAIATDTFNGCIKLVSMTIPEGITTLGANAFANCSSLKTVNIPSTVTSLADTEFELKYMTTTYRKYTICGVFTSCDALESINVAANNEVYASIDGLLYEKNAQGVVDTLVFCPVANAGVNGVLTVPSTVTTFKNAAFQYQTGLKEVILPQGLTVIPDFTFSYSSSIEKVVIPNTVTTLGYASFFKATAVKDLVFEEGNDDNPLVVTDGQAVGGPPTYYGVFVGTKSLTKLVLPERTTKLGAYMMSYVSANNPYDPNNQTPVKEVYIPSKITEIPSGCFYYASGLTTITFAEGCTLKTIKNAAFSNCTSLSSFTVPASVTTLEGAFSGCTGLTSFSFEEGTTIKSLPASLFSNCSKLASFTVPASVTTINGSVFASCKALTSITFETIKEGENAGKSNLASIGNSAFANSGLTSIAFPETVSGTLTLGTYLFATNPSSLTTAANTTLKSAYISASVKALDTVFVNCSALETITVAAGHENISFNAPNLMTADGSKIYYVFSATGEYAIPDGVEDIPAACFKGNKYITKLTIPASVKTIGNFAFANCTALKEIVIAEASKLSSIGNYCFDSCSALETIKFAEEGYYDESKKTYQSITFGTYCFESCISLKSVTFTATTPKLSNYMFYKCSALSSVDLTEVTTLGSYVFGYCGFESIDLSDISSISTAALYYNSKLTSAVLPTNLTNIPAYTFAGCTALESFAIPASYTAINNYAFYGCPFTSVTIPAAVSTIGTYAFAYCDQLEEVNFAANGALASIGANAFQSCTKLKSIDIPETVGTLGASVFDASGIEYFEFSDKIPQVYQTMFQNCTSLKRVVLGDGITTIAKDAFKGCSALEEIVISAKVNTITSGAFAGCTSLANVTVDQGNVVYSSTNGVVFDDNMNLILIAPKTSGEVVLAEGTKLTASAFAGCEKITKVVLPEGLKVIPQYAFENCTSLKEIVLPSSLDTIETYAFNGCTALETIILPEGLTTIGNYAFNGCAGLKTITLPESTINLGTYLFYNCTGLETAVINSRITTTPNYLFYHCESLTDVTLPSTLTSTGMYTFGYCLSLEEITLPDSMKELGSYTFAYSGNLKQVNLPASVTKLGSSSFQRTGIEEIDLSNITDFGDSLCSSCVNLRKVTLPDTIKELNQTMFSGCTSLTEINIPDNITSIGIQALAGTALKEIVIPDTVTTIQFQAFRECQAEKIVISSQVSVIYDQTFYGCTNLKTVEFRGNITSIDYSAFNGCTSLESIVINGTTTSLSHDVFANCTSLKSISGTTKYVNIAEQAFLNCKNLETFNIDATLTSIGQAAFAGCSKLAFTIDEGCQNFKLVNGMLYNKDNVLIACPGATTGTVTMAAGEKLNAYAFTGCKNVTSVTLPSDLTEIPDYAFYNCTGLTTVVIPETVTKIGAHAFDGCTALQAVVIPQSVKAIGESAFAYDTAAITVAEGNTFFKVEDGMLEDMNGQIYYCPANKTGEVVVNGTLNAYAFVGCTLITKVTLGANVTVIPVHCFDGCTSLKTVVFSDKISTIDEYAFNNCTALEVIDVPASISAINGYAFTGCPSATLVFESSIGSATFFVTSVNDWTEAQKIYFPNGTRNSVNANFLSASVKATLVFGERP